MARNSAFFGRAAVFALWSALLASAQASFGGDGVLGDAARRLENGIELQLRRPPATVQDPPAPRSKEADPIEPWELVGV
jgi:hypothetical protein